MEAPQVRRPVPNTAARLTNAGVRKEHAFKPAVFPCATVCGIAGSTLANATRRSTHLVHLIHIIYALFGPARLHVRPGVAGGLAESI